MEGWTMKKIATGALAALTLAGALTATSALPAAAADHHYRGGGHYEGYRGYRGGWHGDGWHGDGAAAALIGLGVGAAIAGGGYYAYPPAYYAPPCHFEMRWNPYWGGYERVRVCY
jgi:hypothetical protein